MAQWLGSSCCSSGGPKFISQHAHGNSQPSVTPAPEGSSALFWILQTPGMHMHRQTYSKIHTNIKKYKRRHLEALLGVRRIPQWQRWGRVGDTLQVLSCPGSQFLSMQSSALLPPPDTYLSESPLLGHGVPRRPGPAEPGCHRRECAAGGSPGSRAWAPPAGLSSALGCFPLGVTWCEACKSPSGFSLPPATELRAAHSCSKATQLCDWVDSEWDKLEEA